MIDYHRYVLPNGLRLVVHVDATTPMAAISVQYDVGSRDESPERTGFAHLFEHLMFGGSAHAPDYDDPIQLAGGENNAFTNADLTNFHVSIPAVNLDTALWLEADRMAHLNISQAELDVQAKVVVEEFKETCLNEPYGDAWHHLSALCYHHHPYRWPTIGLEPRHVAEASLRDVRDFYARHYNADKAIVTVVGPTAADAVYRKVVKYFGELPGGDADAPSGKTAAGAGALLRGLDGAPQEAAPVPQVHDALVRRIIPTEPEQRAARHAETSAPVAVDSLYLAYPMCGRTDEDFYAVDLLTDVLAEGTSSRLYRRLLKEQELAITIDAYVTGTEDPGLIVFEAKPREEVTLEKLKAAIEGQIETLQTTLVPALELEKIKNKLDASMLFSELSTVNKAINLAFYEGIGDLALINTELEQYARVTAEDLRRVAQHYLAPHRQNALYYRATAKGEKLPLALASEAGV